MEPENNTAPETEKQALAAPGWRKWAIIGGLAAALAGGAGVVGAYSGDFGNFGHFSSKHHAGDGPMRAHWGGPGFMGGGIDRMLDEIDATDEQSDKLWKIMDDARGEMRPLMRDFRDTRDDLAKLLSAPTIDKAAVEKLRSERVAEIDQASQKMTAAIVEAAEVLTPEQRTKLIKHFEERRSHRRW